MNDLSSEVIARILPLYLIVVVGSSVMGVGLIEAISEGTAIFSKLLAGRYSDKISKRKPFIFGGYLLSVISRPLILIFPTISNMAASRFLDRLGKGIRTAPRDALIADLSSDHDRGANFGFNRALDTFGAVIGLGAVALFLFLKPMTDAEALKKIVVFASVAGVLALFALIFGVHENLSRPAVTAAQTVERKKFFQNNLSPRFKRYLLVASFFALASSSDAFLIMKAKDFGFSLMGIFIILMSFNVISAASAFPFAKLSDRVGRKRILMAGWLLYAVCYFLMGLPTLSKAFFVVLMLIYGLFYSLTDGVEKALIADFTGEKGTAYAWLGVVNGVGIVGANLLFAALYTYSPSLAFDLSAFFALTGVILLKSFV